MMTHHLNTDFSSGRPCDLVDGDNAVQEEQTVSCPVEAYSIKGKQTGPSGTVPQKSPGGVLIQGLNTPIRNSETLEHGQQAESSANADNNTVRRDQSASEYETELGRLYKKKKKVWEGINKKQGIKIATLNINGRKDKNKKLKWPSIVTLMRKQKILLLGVQESHLDEEEAETVKQRCPKIELISNGTSKNKGGIAFVINKDLANKMTWNHTALMEGRASRLVINVEEDRGLDVTLIYAPNEDKEKEKFFTELEQKLEQEQSTENAIIMGDFNSVEHELDRFPHRKDKESVTEKWLKIKKKYKLIDGWRIHNQLEKGYTFTQQSTLSMSRIDRIYLDENIFPYGYNWSLTTSAHLSDHDIATVEILKQKLPYIGKGIWRMTQDDVDDESVKKETKELLTRVQKEMKEIRDSKKEGIQELWMETKDNIKEIAERAKKKRRKEIDKEKMKLRKGIERKLEEIKEDLQDLNKEKRKELIKLKTKLATKTKDELNKIQEAAKARYRQKGEKYTKYWFKLKKEKLESEIILCLQKPEGSLTTKTAEMAEIALNHHRKLQERPEMNQERQEAINVLKEKIETKTTTDQKEKLKEKTSYKEVEQSLKAAPNGSSPGIDGITYEFYKEKMKDHEKDNENPDIVGILHMVIEEIEAHGLKKINKENEYKKKEFTDGLMRLLFKKKEKWKIENYRPITLLNTDYKTYTKTIAIRLAEVAKTMIHEDQAGFVPQRSLYDHTKTTNLAIEYCEMMDKNGCIIALDQEKAYDKIDHAYLWQVMDKYDFPQEFTARIKELYKSTGKAILINGVMTKQYKVERGVHQGDPMSCLLYNFAIEPLAEAIRKSSLKGIEINENVKRLIISLFADDTLVYLSEKDNIKDLKKIIDTFCKASTARFNMEKTEYLPIGNKEFRKKVEETRKMGKSKIENNVKIVKEGEAMRTLGAWVGNNINTNLQWKSILHKQEIAIEAWSKMGMSLKGKEIILKAMIQSKAMFLATVNGMPKDIEEKMKKMFKDFIWNGKKRGTMAWTQIIAPREQGGLGIPDIKARIEAIEIMWIKRWLTPSTVKPKWTHILDEILNNNISKAPMIDPESRISWIKQSWHESNAKNAKLPKEVKRMLTIARKHNITLEPLKYAKNIKNEEPLWHNRLMTNANYQWNKKSSRCLRSNHKVKTIKDLMEYTPHRDCENEKACKQMVERLKGLVPEIINPEKGTPQKIRIKNLDLTPQRKRRNEENQTKKTFNPDITVKKNILEQVRLFNEEQGTKTRGKKIDPKKPAYRMVEPEPEGKTKARLIVVTEKKGKNDQSIKIKITLTGSTKNKVSFKLGRNEQSKGKAMAKALIWILKKDRKNRLKIITTERSLIKWIGKGINEEEDNAWINTKHKDEWKSVLNLLRERNAKTEIKAPSRKEKKKMKTEKKLLKEKNLKGIKIEATGKGKYLQKGAKLENLTQKTAYELILRKTAEPPGGAQTWRTIKALKKNLQKKWDIRIEDEKLWKDLENIKNPKIQEFIWKIIHNRVKCGNFFKYIPNWQEKQFCVCGKVENIDHILLECKKSKQRHLWKKVKKLWKKITGRKWKRLSIKDIMTVGSIKIENKLTKEIFITMITTAVWTIWKNRNNRVFNDIKETKESQIESWKDSIINEIRMEYELIRQQGIRNKRKATVRFLEKWSKRAEIVRIEENGKGKRRLRINL